MREHAQGCNGKSSTIDFGLIAREAIPALRPLLNRLLPGGSIVGREYVALNPCRADAGLKISRARQREFATYLNGAEVSGRVTQVDRTGWHDIGGHQVFVLPNETISPHCAETIVLDASATGPYEARGTLDNWQKGVGALAHGHTLPGIETCLAAMRATGNPGWAALSTYGLIALDLPGDVHDVIVLADGDDPGDAAACDCAWRWKREGRRVRIARPPQGKDFNDMLVARAPRIEESEQ